MSGSRAERAYEITWLIRRLFRAMASAAEAYLADTGVTTAERAVMEFLYPDRRYSVPEIARRYDVSRQHVQATVNSLLDKRLLRRIDNPRHKRSRLIRLSESGRDSFEAIRRSEADFVDRIFAGVSDDDMQSTQTTLVTVLETLK